MKIKDIKTLIKEIEKGYLSSCKPKGVEGCASCEADLVIRFLERHVEFLEEEDNNIK